MNFKSSIKLIFCYFIAICLETNICNCEDFYASIPDLEKIFIAEKSLMGGLGSYVAGAEQNINVIKTFINDLENNHTKFLEEFFNDQTTNNLFHSLLLKRRLSTSLLNLQDYVTRTKRKMAENFMKIIANNDLPSATDLEGISLALVRIQEVYDMTAEQIANGIIKDLNFGAKFTASDCYEVGLKLQQLGYHYCAIQWYKMTLTLLEEEGWQGVTPEVNEILILKYLAYSQHLEGSIENAKAAIETTIKVLNLDYHESYSIELTLNLKTYIENYQDLVNGVKAFTTLNPSKSYTFNNSLTEDNLTKRGCRGDLKKSPAEERKLFCKYETENHPFLLLAPIKVEVANASPYIVLFHDVIYDSEIEILQELSKDELQRAEIWNQIKEKNEFSNARTSKLTWFNNETHPLMHTLNRRINDMTGLTMETSEDYQIANYGIGGHYDIHHDYLEDVKAPTKYKLDNRIATVLFYLSDIVHGGGTTWPFVNVLVLPKKGTAAFWYNLYADGNSHFESHHSACPVIIGSKWVLNKWIGISGQVFRKPCYLYPDHLG